MADGKETWDSDDYFSSYSSDPFKYIRDYESPEGKKLREENIEKKQNSKESEQEET